MTDRFDRALVFASELHRQQRRRGSEVPYVAHLLAVAAIVMEHGGDEDEAVAALLHDAIEDQGGRETRDEIRRRFGERVTTIVEACTDSWTVPKPPWESRKRAYLERLATGSVSARLVSAADKLHNARSVLGDYRNVGEQLWQRFEGRREGTLWYYRSVVDALARSGRTPLVDELERVVSEIERLAGARDRGGEGRG
ncbi:MAG: HD domain-containing protein [Gemmatimonadota bacterium]|nr:HD domain-containing protein [Gemmatimonadota bacterium]